MLGLGCVALTGAWASSKEEIRTRTKGVFQGLGTTLSDEQIKVAPFAYSDETAGEVATGWNVTVPGYMLRFNDRGDLAGLYPSRWPVLSSEAEMSDAAAWSRGSVLLNLLAPHAPDLSIVRLTRSSQNPRLAKTAFSGHQIKLEWTDARQTLPGAGTLEMRFDASSGRLIGFENKIPAAYGPTLAGLSVGDARTKAKSYLSQIAAKKPEDEERCLALSRQVDAAHPKTIWSEGGGAYGLFSSMVYFKKHELRVGYQWTLSSNEIIVDANTGELLYADAESNRTSFDAGPVRGQRRRSLWMPVRGLAGAIALVGAIIFLRRQKRA
jgi:hypothetical protein